MSIFSATSSLPLLLILTWLCFFVLIIILHKLFTKFIPHSIISTYIIPVAARMTWAWEFTLHYSLFPNSHHHNMNHLQENGDDLGLYNKPEPGSEDGADCAVCLCKIEEEEEIREVMRCGHIFHRECLDRWVDNGHRNKTCPLCRGSLAPPRMINEVGEEVIVFKFLSFCSGSTNNTRSMWWLRWIHHR